MYKKFLSVILSPFDVPSDIIVGLWSLIILVGCMFSILKTHEVSPPVATIFSVVITNFAAHKISKVWKGPDNQDQTSQGDNNGNASSKS